MSTVALPPLPASSGKALEWNMNDSYYNVKAGDFWAGAEIVREEVGPDIKCEHKFRVTPTGVQCSTCHFGLIGPIEVRDEKLFYKGQQLPL